MNNPPQPTPGLVDEVRQLIDESRRQVAASVNASLTLLYWQIGRRINADVLGHQRADYGSQVVATLSAHLTAQYGAGWGKRQLHYCMQLADVFPQVEIVNAVRSQLSWTHLRLIIQLDDPLKREFYIEMCRLEKWSSRQLQERMQSMLYERTAISRKPEQTIQAELAALRQDQTLSPDLVFRDPYVLDFLGLADTYSERDLETAIIVELQRFLTEMGSDFAFMARQKRISIDNRDYYIDLLFYHRRLRCLVAIDLKLGEFEAAYKGQMELYLRYLERYEQLDGENTPIGLILCAGKNEEHVELLQLDRSNIRVADYLTVLPPRQVLQEKLHRAIEVARQKINRDESV